MELNYLVENLQSLLIKYSSSKTQIEENLYELFSSLDKKKSSNQIENLSEFVLLAASLFELKSKRMLPQDSDVEWLEEVQVLKDKDLAFARLLQFKAYSEIGIALGSRIKKNENRINAFKYYVTKNLFPKPDIDYYIDVDRFTNIGNEVFSRYRTIEGFKHIDKDLPDLQDAIDNFLEVVNLRISTSFDETIKNLESSEEAIAFFLALLEAVRWGFVTAVQDKETINIEKNNEF
jgi:segregation and condensation protein A